MTRRFWVVRTIPDEHLLFHAVVPRRQHAFGRQRLEALDHDAPAHFYRRGFSDPFGEHPELHAERPRKLGEGLRVWAAEQHRRTQFAAVEMSKPASFISVGSQPVRR